MAGISPVITNVVLSGSCRTVVCKVLAKHRRNICARRGRPSSCVATWAIRRCIDSGRGVFIRTSLFLPKGDHSLRQHGTFLFCVDYFSPCEAKNNLRMVYISSLCSSSRLLLILSVSEGSL